MIGNLSMSEFHATFLAQFTCLEQANAETMALVIYAILNKIWPNFDSLLLWLQLSDAVSFLSKCRETVEPDIVTTLGHGPNSHNFHFLSQGDMNCSIKNPNEG